MKGAVVRQHGWPPKVAVEELPPVPQPEPDEVVVKVVAGGINFPDLLVAAQLYQVPVQVPFVTGCEFAGLVKSVGVGVKHLKPGDSVCGTTMFVGAFAEEICVKADAANRLPDGADLVSAAAFPVCYLTAYQALKGVANVKEGEWVVVLGATGGVGMSVVDLATVLGAQVIAVGRGDKVRSCVAAGARATIDHERDDLKLSIRELTGGGADVVIDPVGGRQSELSLRAMRWGGRFVTVGYASGDIPAIPLNLVLLKGVTIGGTGGGLQQHRPDLAARLRAEVFELYCAGDLSPRISHVFSLDRVADAYELLVSREIVGKAVVRIEGAS